MGDVSQAFGSRVLSLLQIDRVRWIMFPQVRVQTQGALFDDQDEQAQLPDILHVPRSSWRARWAMATAWRARARP